MRNGWRSVAYMHIYDMYASQIYSSEHAMHDAAMIHNTINMQHQSSIIISSVEVELLMVG